MRVMSESNIGTEFAPSAQPRSAMEKGISVFWNRSGVVLIISLTHWIILAREFKIVFF